MLFFHAGQTVQTEVSVDDLLGELALWLGFGFEVGEHGGREAVVGLHFVGLEHQALSRKTVFECVHGRTLLAFDGLRTRGF